MSAADAAYVELQVTTHFSFLRGASSPEELFAAAALLGLPALGIIDRGSVAGIVRAWDAEKTTGVRAIVGCRLDLTDGTALLIYPTDKASYGRMCRLLSVGKARAGKGACHLDWADVEAWSDGLLAMLVPDKADAVAEAALVRTRRIFGDRAYMALTVRRRPRDAIRLADLAANHIADCGAEGIADTCDELDRLSIAHCGAAATLAEARRPALLESNGRRIALLSYNCVGPEISWAAADRAGSAYVAVGAADGGPSRPQADLVEADPASLDAMRGDIADAARAADFVVVALHKGITHRPAMLAPYERPVAYAAIDAGANAVVGHHAHIARGIELHRGCPIFHGLGNGVVVTHALSAAQNHPARAEWAERRKRLFGFEPDPAYVLAPFHPEAANGLIGRLRWHPGGRLESGFTPIWFEPPGRPVLPRSPQKEAVAAYIASIGLQAGLPSFRSRWQVDRYVID